MNILDYQHFYLVGIKGVAMTALAQCLLDAGKKVIGCDVAENFVTTELLQSLPVSIAEGFTQTLPDDVECVVYTAAHGGSHNPIVKQASEKNIPTYSHAQALADLFNQKQGVAVAGVGGKSTTSAMITWILEKTGREPSFAIGVGSIPGLARTGKWSSQSQYFIVEADEYATDPAEVAAGKELVPRFAYYQPFITVCTNLRFDHPDVYRDFEHTYSVFLAFFNQLKSEGTLVLNADDDHLLRLAQQLSVERPDISYVTFGESPDADASITQFDSQNGLTSAVITFKDESVELKLRIPGKYNVRNAAAALLACQQLGVSLAESAQALVTFNSTQRRSEFIGEKHGVMYYDDYAHHPSEIQQVIQAFREWYPERKLIVAFQAHTLTRTKTLFDQFADAFAAADEVAMIEIFTSAREQDDKSVSSDQLCEAITQNHPRVQTANFHNLENLADHLSQTTNPGDVVLTVGAGDIYKVHDLIR